MTNCLQCTHAHTIIEPGGKINFLQKICRESPPIPLVIGIQNGQPMVQAFFPIVSKESICDRFDPKLFGEERPAVEAEGKPQ